MSLANPAILWALPLGLIPIVIYYLLRFRALKVVWGANYVLELALARLRRQLHWDQILLIALRVAACLLIVLAFARPVLRRRSVTVIGGGVHHIIVLDGSYSMLAGTAGSTRWDRNLEAIENLVSTWGRGERWSLYLLDRRPHWVVDDQRVESADQSLALLEPLQPAESAASLATAFSEIAEKTGDGPCEIFLFADDQATTWEGMESIRLPGDADADVYWFCPPLADTTNVAVTSVRPAIDRVLLRHPQRVFVSLCSYAADPIDELPVELLVDGVFRDRQLVGLLPGQRTTIHFDVRFEQTGSHYLTARLADDALRFDNAMSAGIEVVESLYATVLRDPDRQGKFDSAWGFFEVARRASRLVAETSGDAPTDDGRPSIQWTLCEDPKDAATLATADVVYLDGGCRLSPELAAQLAEFVDRGGGLMLAADPSVDADSWNRILGDAGLLPAPLGALRVEQIGGERFRSLSRTDFDTLPLRAFETDEHGDLTQAKFFSWFAFEEDPERADVLARFDDHSPWLMRQRRDSGRVLLSATGLAGRGHNLFVREFALPLLTGLFQEAAAGRIYSRTVSAGRPVQLVLRDAATLRGVSFGRQDRDPLPVQTQPLDDAALATVDRRDLDSGLYRFLAIRDEGSQPIWFGVQGPRVDSDLTALSDRRRAAVTEQLGLVEAADWQQLDQLLAAARTGCEWHPWVVVLALCVLAGEMLFQRRFAPQRSVGKETTRTRTA
jgi:hypothetical protein